MYSESLITEFQNAELERDWHDLLSECGRRMQISDFQLPEELWKVKPEPPPPSDFTTPPLRIQSSLTYGIASNSPWAIFSGNSSSSSHSSHSGEFDIVDFSGEEEPKQDSDGGERKGNEIKDGDEDGTIDDNTVFTLEDLPELSETEPVNPVELISLEDFELLDENGPFTRDTTEEPTPITTTTTTTTTQAENTDSSNELASNSGTIFVEMIFISRTPNQRKGRKKIISTHSSCHIEQPRASSC